MHEHTAAAVDAYGGGDARRAQLMQSAVRHLHAFVEEVGLTHAEWEAALGFMAAVAGRDECILLSDTLGVSMMLELVNERDGASAATVLGPYYLPGAPEVAFGGSIVADPATGGTPMTVQGTIRNGDGAPVDGALVEIWMVQPDGRYDIEVDPERRNLRGWQRTGPDGRYRFAAVRPVDYTIPDDGPVGAMLRASGRHPWRPAHVHLKVTAEGHAPLVTHVFDDASPYLDSDVVFGVRPDLVVAMGGPVCTFDVTLAPA